MSGFLLDTNVLSEAAKPQRHPGVMAFLTGLDDAFISVLSIHELTYGIERLPSGTARRATLTKTIEALLSTFADRIIGIGQAEARAAASLRAQQQGQGRTLHLADALIAATALVHAQTLVTRNVSDFTDLGVMIHNPWEEGS